MAITLDKLLRCHMTEDEARRFKRVEVEIRDDCWLAISHSLTSTGYPRWRGLQSNLMTPMQRDIYEKTHGTSIPDDKVVIRTCGNKNCCNPAHLELRDKKTTVELMRAREKDRRKKKDTMPKAS